NENLAKVNLSDTAAFSDFIRQEIERQRARIGAGGYAENRIIYNSHIFTSAAEPRTLHLGTDIWAPAGTQVAAPISGRVHSFANNAAYRDFGPTVILEHNLEENRFYTLYGHLSKASLSHLYKGKNIPAGTVFAAIGAEDENVQWPPHLHFQVITDVLGREGDFFGVAPISQKEYFLSLCPNPNLILRIKELENL
ncbi:MAG: peptidase M23, partial [Chitinophagaceae bacterium]